LAKRSDNRWNTFIFATEENSSILEAAHGGAGIFSKGFIDKFSRSIFQVKETVHIYSKFVFT
jgi:hypothetical protein